MDEDTMSNDTVGSASIKFSALIMNTDDWFEISYKGKVAGTVHLVSEFVADDIQEVTTKGKLTLEIIEAKLSRDTDTFGDMEPYLTV
jgi:hypothetical protein